MSRASSCWICLSLASVVVCVAVDHHTVSKKMEFACDQETVLAEFNVMTNRNNEEVEVAPSWNKFRIQKCTEEGSACYGISKRFESRCVTNMTYTTAIVRPVGSRGEFYLDQVSVPGPCLCWLYQ